MATILVVDDDQALNDLLRTHLQADGYSVLQAYDGPSALKIADQTSCDLAILDWMLPGMDGLAVCRRLRQKYLMPIIMLTARNEEVDQILGLEVGADDYINKPFSIRQVQARVRAMLRRVDLESQRPTGSATPVHKQSVQVVPPMQPVVPVTPPIVYGPLTIDLARRAVLVDSREVTLTPKEYDLLVLLASHPGWVFKREVLLQQIWGDDYEGFDRTIDNHLTRLRKKLGPVGDKIETVWGVGYRLMAVKE